jgi:hypothetical protein
MAIAHTAHLLAHFWPAQSPKGSQPKSGQDWTHAPSRSREDCSRPAKMASSNDDSTHSPTNDQGGATTGPDVMLTPGERIFLHARDK